MTQECSRTLHCIKSKTTCEALCPYSYNFNVFMFVVWCRMQGNWLREGSSLHIDGMRIPFQVVGDSAYPQLDCLLTPVKETRALTDQEHSFNNKHSSTRMVVEQAIGLLKSKWTALTSSKCAEVTIERRCKDVLACCCLHNIEIDIGGLVVVDSPNHASDGEGDNQAVDLLLFEQNVAVQRAFVNVYG